MKYQKQFHHTGIRVLNEITADRSVITGGVDVDEDYQLDVLSNGKYQLTKIDNDGSSGEFEYHVAEEGQLQKLNKDSK